MEITTPTIELIAITPNAEKVIEQAGRTCYMSFDRATDLSMSGFIRSAIKREHLSILEHASATFRISGVSRAFSHQIVRHRIASFSQQSQRYVSETEFDYILPPSIKSNAEAHELYRNFIENSRQVYAKLREMDVLKEDARFVLPNAVSTELVFTANLREMRHFFQLRLEKHAQWEIRRTAYLMLEILKEECPNVFADFVLVKSNWTATTDISQL